MFGILETKIRREHLASTVSHCFPPHWLHYSNIDVMGSTARIILAWDSLVLTVNILTFSPQMVLAKVASVEWKKDFFVSIIYGANGIRDRRQLWAELRTAKFSIGNAAWVQLGDFNIVRKPTKRLMGFDSAATSEFNTCLYDVEMDDLRATGYWYTWSNKCGGVGDNKSKLDRVLVNTSWLDEFPNSEACFLAPRV